jgi:hypothetical protein
MTALHEAAHAALAYSFVPWGQIVLPFASPLRAYARPTSMMPDFEAMTFFAGCAMDRATFGHALFAQGDFFNGYQILVNAYGHDRAAIRAPILMDRAERDVLELLPNIQALAVEAMPKAALKYDAFAKAVRRAGLESRRIGPMRAAEVDAHLAQFASKPEQLRRELGLETLLAAHSRLSEAWFRVDPRNVRIPACQCGCGKPLLGEDTVRWALIEGWTPRLPLPETYPHHFWRPGFF